VYVGNLSWETSWQSLKDHFRSAGEVTHADVMTEPNGRSKGCAIVRFASAQDAANAIQQLHDSELDGRTIFVREDREAGGGGGGVVGGGGFSAETGGLPPPVAPVSRAVGGGRGAVAQQYGAPAVGLPPAPKAAGGGSGSRVYVGNLSWETSWQELKDHFRNAGEVSHADVMMEHDGRSKGCGIVSFASARDAGTAIGTLHDSELHGRKIFVREDREASVPGGGKGGGQGTAGCQVYVGNLPWETTWMNLKDHFREAGNVLRADVVTDPEGKSRGFGTVLFSTTRDAAKAIQLFNETPFGSRTIEVRPDQFQGR